MARAKTLGLGKPVFSRPLALNGSDLARFGKQTVEDMRKVLHGRRGEAATIVGQAQEFMTANGMAMGRGDALIGDYRLFAKVAEKDRNLASAMIADRLAKLFEGPQRLAEAMQTFGIQEYTTKSDFPAQILDIIEKYHTGTEDVDTGWRKVFDVRDFTGSKKGGFKIRSMGSGLVFRRVPTGDSVDVYKMTGTDIEVDFDMYGGGLGWERKWWEDEEYWQASETALEFRSKYYNDMADAHYALIEAIGASIDVTWQNPDPAALAAADSMYTVSRDIQTMNAAALAIILALKSAGMDINPGTQLGILAPENLRSRITRTMAVTYGIASMKVPMQVAYAMTPTFTNRLLATDKYYIFVPGRKAKSGNRMDLTTFTDFDLLSYSDTVAGWGRYGAGIGEVDQFRRCATV